MKPFLHEAYTASICSKYHEYHFLIDQIALFHARSSNFKYAEKLNKTEKIIKYNRKLKNVPKHEIGM